MEHSETAQVISIKQTYFIYLSYIYNLFKILFIILNNTADRYKITAKSPEGKEIAFCSMIAH